MKDIVIKLSTLTIVLCLLLSINTFATPPLNMGQVAPDISLPDQNKTVLSLSSLRGKIVLVQFWASWEPNSRVNNPNLAKIRNQYATATFKNASGFELYTVSLDSENEKWVDAIKNDGLPGSYHVNDFFSKYVGIYKVTKLPASFLLDANGIVIGKNLSNTALQQKLASYSKGGSVAKTAPIYTPPTPIRQTTTTTTDPVAVDQRPNRPDYKIPPPARYRNNSTATNTYRYQPSTQSAPTSGYQPNMQSTVSRSNGNGNTNYVTQSFQVQTPNGIKTVTGLVAAPAAAQTQNYVMESRANDYQTVANTTNVVSATNANTTLKYSYAPLYDQSTQQQQTVATQTPPTAPKTTIYAPIGISYRVQVGAFKQPKMTNFYNASRYGKVLKESTNTGVQRILVGDYNADVHAVDALLKLQSDGYSDAFVVMYENGKRTRVLATEEVSDIAIRMNGSTTVASNATGYTEQKVEQQQPTYMVNKVAPPPPAPIPVSAPVVPAPVPTPPPPTPTPPVPTAPVPSVATAPTPYAAPQYIAPPPPIYYAPQPIYYTPPPIYYTQPQTVYQLPAAPQPQVKETVATPPPASSVAAKPTTPNTGYVGTSTSKSVAVNSTTNSKPVRSNYPMYTGTTTTTRPSSTPTYRSTTTSTPSRSSRITYNNSTSEWKQTIPGTNVTYGLSKSYQDPTSTITSSTSSSYTQSSLASSSPAYSSSTYTGTATTKPYIPPYSGTTTTTKPYTPTYTGRTTTSRPSSGTYTGTTTTRPYIPPYRGTTTTRPYTPPRGTTTTSRPSSGTYTGTTTTRPYTPPYRSTTTTKPYTPPRSTTTTSRPSSGGYVGTTTTTRPGGYNTTTQSGSNNYSANVLRNRKKYTTNQGSNTTGTTAYGNTRNNSNLGSYKNNTTTSPNYYKKNNTGTNTGGTGWKTNQSGAWTNNSATNQNRSGTTNTTPYNNRTNPARTNTGQTRTNTGQATNQGWGNRTNTGQTGARTNTGQTTNQGWGNRTNTGQTGARTNTGQATNQGWGNRTNTGQTGARTNTGQTGTRTNAAGQAAASKGAENLKKALDQYLTSYDYLGLGSTKSRRLKSKQKRLEKQIRRAQKGRN